MVRLVATWDEHLDLAGWHCYSEELQVSVSSFQALVSDSRLRRGHHQVRFQVFTIGEEYDTPVNAFGEADEFDRAGAMYVNCWLAGAIIGCMRLVPTVGHHLISRVWPESVTAGLEYAGSSTWEGSRLCVSKADLPAHINSGEVLDALIQGMEHACASVGARSVVGSMDPLHWASIFERRGYSTEPLGPTFDFKGFKLESRRLQLKAAS